MRLGLGLGLTKPSAGSGGGAPSSAYDIILLAGQSNMEGRGTRDAGIDTDVANVEQFGGYATGGLYQIIGSDITPLQHPGPNVNINNYVGIGEYVGRTYLANNPGRKVLLVPVSFGGTSLVGGSPTWNSGTPGGTRYEFAISQANLAIAAAQAIDPSSAIVGTTWIQGETDGDNAVATATYLTAFNALIAGFRARITGATNMWFVVGSMVPEAITNSANYRLIDNAHLQATLVNTNIAFERGPRGFTADNLHYNAAGVRLMGPAMANALSRVAKPEVLYDFQNDILSTTTPKGIIVDLSPSASGKTPLIVSNGGSQKLTCSGSGAIGGVFGVLFEAVQQTQADQVIEFTESYTTAGRWGITLRAQTGTPSDNTGRDGYLIQPASGYTGYRILEINSGVATLLAGPSTHSPLSGRRHRVSAIGSTITHEISDNGGASWATVNTATDSTFATGRIAYVQGFVSAISGEMFLDDVSIRNSI
jgi:hypothetical protein